MTEQLETVVLNANQRRHFEVLFARLEDSLSRIEALLAVESMRGQVLSVLEDDLTDELRDRFATMIAALRGQIRRIAGTLSLRPRKVSRSRVIAATLTAEAIRIEDSLSSQLRGYGEIHASVNQHLDPILEAMAQTLNGLASSLRRRTSPPTRE